jgi:ABC-type transporter Mla maintaining outer membrane lipid asymmetry permease subunit MlaE
MKTLFILAGCIVYMLLANAFTGFAYIGGCFAAGWAISDVARILFDDDDTLAS